MDGLLLTAHCAPVQVIAATTVFATMELAIAMVDILGTTAPRHVQELVQLVLAMANAAMVRATAHLVGPDSTVLQGLVCLIAQITVTVTMALASATLDTEERIVRSRQHLCHANAQSAVYVAASTIAPRCTKLRAQCSPMNVTPNARISVCHSAWLVASRRKWNLLHQLLELQH